MKKTIFMLPLLVMLTGCPGGKPASHSRYTYINDGKLCFSVDKNNTLNYYRIESNQNKRYSIIKSDKGLNLKYPENCINIKWKYGYSYIISYGLDGKNYVHRFFIDNNGQLTNTEY